MFVGIRRMDKVPNARAKKLRGITKGVDERINEGSFQLFGHVKRPGNDRIAKIYVGECLGNHLVCRPRKRWFGIIKRTV